VQERALTAYIWPMCGRFTRNYTWQQLHALYRLTVPVAIPNFQPRYNVCPTDPADVVVPNDGARDLVEMRWGLVPYWWNKPLKELRLATFNAGVETVTTKPFFREPFKTRRCLMPVSAGADDRGAVGSVEEPRDRRADQVMHDDHYRAK
jgi:putative SOS response-associated peptidase YedK